MFLRTSTAKKMITDTKHEVVSEVEKIRKNLEDRVNSELEKAYNNMNNEQSNIQETLDGCKNTLLHYKKEIDRKINSLSDQTPIIYNINIKDTVKVKTTDEELFHKEFESILKLVNVNIPLMLVGMAGTGKNHTLEQVAKTLSLDFYFSNAITNEFKLTGFIDAGGKYNETQFYKAFKNGGLFMLDEVDASSPDALVVINAAIANKYFDFPHEKVKAHPDFRICCAANTYGRGSDLIYTGRNSLDGATLDRFATIYFDYDDVLERKLSASVAIYEFTQVMRSAVQELGLRHTVSMRATIMASQMMQIEIPISNILEMVYFKGLKSNEKTQIKNIIKNKYENTGNDFIEVVLSQ